MESLTHCLDLKAQHIQIKKEMFKAFEAVYEQTAFSGGKFVEQFEAEFSGYIGTTHAIGVNNGTSALHLALIAIGIKPGDEIIVPANTFIATAWAVSYVGAVPVFVDCDPMTWEIDITKIDAAITSRTKAIIGVHLYGQPFDIDPVIEICKKRDLYLIEDAAQAQGARYKGKNTGTFGSIGCFSFYPGKNLGACGEAGGIVTNNNEYDKQIRMLRNHGSSERYYHDIVGYNYRMGGLEGASLSVKLNYLESWNNQRRAIASRYRKEISNPLIKLQHIPEWSDGVYHLFVITTDQKDALVKHLSAHQIAAAFHYPVPCHLQKAYTFLGYKKGDLPNAEYLSEHCISLPMYPELEDDAVSNVITALNSFSQ